MEKALEEQINAIPGVDSFPYPIPGTPSGDNILALKALLDSVIDKLQEMESQGTIKSTMIYDLDDGHPLKQAIHVVLQEAGDTAIASWPELHLYGEGETPNDAINTLKTEIIHLFDDLSSTHPTQLGVLPQRWLRTLRQVIQTNA
ncbi:MAG: hypothetical protein HY680_04335 [Chloroflexi bacterium]|nr:hypothetical protein [Chloroflexota bacterium]